MFRKLQRYAQIVGDPYLQAALLGAFVMVFMKKWYPGGNLDTIWYSAVAKNIYLTGDYFKFFISKYYFKDIFDHMPMTYWITAKFFEWFGPSDFTARLYPMICSFASYILIYLIGTKLKDKTFGLVALATHAMCFGASKWNGALMHDVPLTTFYLAAFYTFLPAETNSKLYYVTSIFMTFGVFSKGPIIFGFPLGLFFWSVIHGETKFLKNRHFYWSTALFSVLLAVPLLPQFEFQGLSAYTMFYLWKASYLAESKANEYFAYFIVISQTATITLLPFLWSAVKILRHTEKPSILVRYLRLAFWVSICIVVPLSYFGIKYPHYLLPFYPFLSLVAALSLDRLFRLWPYSFPKTLSTISVLAICLFAAFPLKTTGKRSKEVLNIVNVIKLDRSLKNKMVYYLGKYFDDMTLFQTFKFYGSIDVKPIRPYQLSTVDPLSSYLIMKREHLPVALKGSQIGEENCFILNTLYCVYTHREQVSFELPEFDLPHEVY